MIQLQNLSAGYAGKPVVRKVSLDFPEGTVTVLLGPNGSGKSTLVKAALGLLPALEGRILYDGKDIRDLKPRQIARRAAWLTQSRDTPSIVAQKMVLHGRFPYSGYPRQYSREDYTIARAAMEVTGCLPYENENVRALSGGQRQSVYLAMTLAQDTPTVFMDEPTTYLDIRRQLEILQTARQLASQGRAVVLILHDIALALERADRVAVLREGELICADTPEAVFRSGLLGKTFRVGLHRMETPHGMRYYYTEEGE